MEFILYGAGGAGIFGLIFFGYQFARRVGLRCVDRGEKTCVGDKISEFYMAEDQQNKER